MIASTRGLKWEVRFCWKDWSNPTLSHTHNYMCLAQANSLAVLHDIDRVIYTQSNQFSSCFYRSTVFFSTTLLGQLKLSDSHLTVESHHFMKSRPAHLSWPSLCKPSCLIAAFPDFWGDLWRALLLFPVGLSGWPSSVKCLINHYPGPQDVCQSRSLLPEFTGHT